VLTQLTLANKALLNRRRKGRVCVCEKEVFMIYRAAAVHTEHTCASPRVYFYLCVSDPSFYGRGGEKKNPEMSKRP